MSDAKKMRITDKKSPSTDNANDDLLSMIGNGRYQICLILFLCCFISPFMASNNIPQYLILLEPEYECKNVSYVNISTARGPLHHDISSLSLKLKRQCYQDQDNNVSVPCKYGYEYKYDFIYPTIVSINDWICDNDSYKFSAHSIYWLGSFFGVLFIGYISDV